MLRFCTGRQLLTVHEMSLPHFDITAESTPGQDWLLLQTNDGV